MMQPVDDSGMIRPLVQTHKNYGFAIGFLLVIFNAIIYIARWEETSWISWVVYFIFLGGLILNARAFAKANNGAVSFGAVFSSNFKATAIVALCIALWSLASIYIFPELKERSLEAAHRKMESMGRFSEEQIEQGMDATRRFFLISRVMGNMFLYLVMGLIFSLIAAAVVPKNKRPLTPVV